VLPCRVWRHIATRTRQDKARRSDISLDIAKRSLDTDRVEPEKKMPTRPGPADGKALRHLLKPKQ